MASGMLLSPTTELTRSVGCSHNAYIRYVVIPAKFVEPTTPVWVATASIWTQ